MLPLPPLFWFQALQVLESGFRDFQPQAISEALTWRPDSYLKGAGWGRGQTSLGPSQFFHMKLGKVFLYESDFE